MNGLELTVPYRLSFTSGRAKDSSLVPGFQLGGPGGCGEELYGKPA